MILKPSAYSLALLLWLCACGNAKAQTTQTSSFNIQGLQTALSCTKDGECPSRPALRVYIRLQ